MSPTFLLIAVLVPAVLMCVLGWMRRESPLAKPYVALTSAILLWTLAYVWELEATTLESMVLSAKVQYLAIPFIPPAVLVFCLRYAGYDTWPTRLGLALLLLVPVTTTVLAWTNENHGLIWSRMTVASVGSQSALSVQYGAFFVLYIVLSYGYLVGALLVVAQSLFRPTAWARRQSALLLAGLLLPWAANFLQVSGLGPYHPLDLTPFALVLTSILAAVVALNLRVLTLAPVARDQIVKALAEGIVVTDQGGRVVDVNRAGAVILSTTQREAVGADARELLGPFVQAMDRRSTDGTLVSTHVRGEGRTYHCTWVDVTGRSGRALGGALAMHDVTHLTGLHRALEQTQAALENEVLDRERELWDAYDRLDEEMGLRRQAQDEGRALEARLRRSQKLETVGTLAGGIAHDFNNILTAIMGYTDLALMRSEQDPALESYLSHVSAASQRARALVEQILTFSRRAETVRRPLALQDSVEEVVGLLRSTLPSTIEIDVALDRTCGAVYADPTQIHQLLMNLGTNAKQAMAGDGGTLSIELDHGYADGEFDAEADDVQGRHCARLRVRDTGSGMNEQTRRRVFEPFFSGRRQSGGSGLGLSVVHGIVLGHGGAIRIESAPWKGSCFEVYLPLVESFEAYESKQAVGSFGGSERLIVVDDEAPIAAMLSQSLGSLGYDVTAFTDGATALDAFARNPGAFDLVITDNTMPRMTGLELASRITTIRPGMPIILQTGHKEPSVGPRAVKAGVFASLQKPLSTGELTTVIRKALD